MSPCFPSCTPWEDPFRQSPWSKGTFCFFSYHQAPEGVRRQRTGKAGQGEDNTGTGLMARLQQPAQAPAPGLLLSCPCPDTRQGPGATSATSWAKTQQRTPAIRGCVYTHLHLPICISIILYIQLCPSCFTRQLRYSWSRWMICCHYFGTKYSREFLWKHGCMLASNLYWWSRRKKRRKKSLVPYKMLFQD